MNPLVNFRLNETTQPPQQPLQANNLGTLGVQGNGSYFGGCPGVTGALVASPDTAARFDGAVGVPYSPSLSLNAPFTVEAWLKPSAINAVTLCPISSATFGANRSGWLIYQNGNSWNLRMYNGNGANTAVDLNAGAPIIAGKWYHLAATYDGSTASLYVNGVASTAIATPPFNPNINGPLTIGMRSDGAFAWPGAVDEPAIYGTVLSAAEITAHYQNGTNASPPFPYSQMVLGRSPLIYLRLDEPALPVAVNSGSLGPAANGTYETFTLPGVPGVPYPGFGVGNFGCQFNGSNGYLDVPGAGLDLTGPVTMVAWCKAEPANGIFQTLVGKGDTSYRLDCDWNGYPRFADGNNDDAVGTIRIDDSQWHFLAGTYDGVASNSLYIDGLLNSWKEAPNPITGSPNDLWIGGAPDYGSQRPFHGVIDEVAIFPYTLSPIQIQQLNAAAFQVPPVRLTIQQASSPENHPLFLGWPQSPLPWQLESTTGLAAPPSQTRWLPITVPATTVNGLNQVVLAAPSGNRLFRLRSSQGPQLSLQSFQTDPTGGQLGLFYGSGLNASVVVRIDGMMLANQTVVSDTLITATIPALSPGTHTIELFNTNTGQVISSVLNAVTVGTTRSVSQEKPKNSPAMPCTACTMCVDASSAHAGNPKDTAGDPVYLFSGEFYESDVDLRIPGRGMDFVWARKYRSRIGPNTAQGNGWDFSYNVRVEANGTNVDIFDGNTRQDTFFRLPDSSFAANQFFSLGNFGVGNSFVLTFADTGTWRFFPLDGSPTAGKLAAITDRNGNAITFGYHPANGRLTNVTDTLGRNISVTYNADGFIDSVTDFAGRSVHYAYYQNADPGGSFGDLKSVTSPPVTGTPNGNDFPSGKTVTYTYSKGFGDDRLNHNLLAITDAKGQTYLQNTYATNENPADPSFDHLASQAWGDPSNILEYVYLPQIPSPTNGFAIVKTIVNDRVGNVTEFLYNSFNLLVDMREYTGRAVAGQPTTDVSNRPTGKLRASDPTYFETRYEYNADSQLTRTVFPNGNSTELVHEVDQDPWAVRRSRGNVRRVRHVPGPLGGDQTELVEYFDYDAGASCGACGFNFVTRQIDARGNATRHTYDSHGNRTRTVHAIPSIVEDFEYNSFGQRTTHVLPDNGNGYRRRDSMTYYTSGPQTGYMSQSIIDDGGFSLTTSYEYDAVGNLTRMIDPRGHDTLYTVNALNQTVRQSSREVTDGSGVRYETLTWYDANNNVVRMDIENRDETGALQANTNFTTIYEYEILNHRTRTVQEKGNANLDATVLTLADIPVGQRPEFIVTAVQYDPNRNPTNSISGEAAAGRQPLNTVFTLYDERDLVFQETRAPGSFDQSTTQHDYDANRNVAKTLQGLEDAPRSTFYAYDGFNRRTSSTDAMGNVATNRYDPNGNLVSSRLYGELLDLPGAAGNVRLRDTAHTYDALNRRIQTDQAFFDPASQTPIGDGFSTVRTIYSDNSQVLAVVDDNSHGLTNRYDTANRLSSTTDAKGNTTTYAYDASSNLRTVTELEKSDLGSLDQTFVTSREYDNLDRALQSVDNIANTNRIAYDSRNNSVLTTDANGNRIRNSFDGLNRLLSTARDMNNNGVFTDPEDVVTSQTWDDNSRLTSQTDDKTNMSAYAYDALDRQILSAFADGTTASVGYDSHDNVIQSIDANGTVLTNAFDPLNRLTNRLVSPGLGVSPDTTYENYQYDGMSRLICAEDNDSLVTRTYDSLSHLTRETQQLLPGGPVAVVTTTFDGEGNPLTSTYPGGRTITNRFDELERKQQVSDTGGLIALYRFFGPERLERRDYGNGTRASYAYDGILPNPTGDFGVKRLIGITHSNIAGGIVLDARTMRWDRTSNKTLRQDPRPGGPGLTQTYTYDAAFRLTHAVVTDPVPTIQRDTTYNLDGVGNRISVVGQPDPGPYTASASPGIADRQMNQYTTTPMDSREYDLNGNLTKINSGQPDERRYTYDFRNRLVTFEDDGSGNVAAYAYDAFGRRVRRIVNGITTRYLYDGWREIEEQNAAAATLATYVYGVFVDEVLQMQRGGSNVFYHADDLFNVTALSDATGAVVERYDYQDFGQPSFFAALGTPLAQSAAGNPCLFTGRRFDPETGWYYYRTRYLDPRAGRFVTHDMIGAWGDPGNLGNTFTYVGNHPASSVDPMGLFDSGLWDSFAVQAKMDLGKDPDFPNDKGAYECMKAVHGKNAADLLWEMGTGIATAPYQTAKLLSGEMSLAETAEAVLGKLAEKAKEALKEEVKQKLKDFMSKGWECQEFSTSFAGKCNCHAIFCYNKKTTDFKLLIEGKIAKDADCCKPVAFRKLYTGKAKKDKDNKSEPYNFSYR